MILRLLSAALLLLLAAPATAVPELEEREAIVDEVSRLYYQRDFAALSKLAQRYRSQGSRTESGLWKLTLFYSGINRIAMDTRTSERLWQSTGKAADDWAAAAPQDPTPWVAQAKFHISRAWQYRGGDWARNVPEQNMAAFHQELQQAESLLLRHKDIASKDPEWYRCMLIVANGLDWDRARFASLMDEATQRHPYYYEIYFVALEYLTPRWHGSHKDIDDFISFAVSRTRAREGNGLYARIYWLASQIEYGDRLAIDSLMDWQRMKPGINDVLARYPDQWNINNFARFACLAGDRDMTRTLVMKMETHIAEGWGDIGMTGYADCLNWAVGKAEYPAYLNGSKAPAKLKKGRPASRRNAA